MYINGTITGIKYKVGLADELQIVNEKEFDINTVPSACIVQSHKHSFAVSRWVSPKRTRSYPYERVYNTLNISKKITVIPVVKDEGAAGDRDFIQWDTVSLMSLLDVFVIFAFYDKANKKDKKITNQKYDAKYVTQKLKEISQYHSSALHWNLNELNNNLHNVLNKAKSCYNEIEKSTGVKLHNPNGLENFQNKIGRDVSLFMDFSRGKAAMAQLREFRTVQPKERLSTLTKANITITNYLGGVYFFTVDEVVITKDKLLLIEGKHSSKSLLPSKGDIKDGLLKLILYSNLSEVSVSGKKIKCESILQLTSLRLKGSISSSDKSEKVETFLKENKFSPVQKKLISNLMAEAKSNNFTVIIKQVK